jgi:parallel beta-helix repeat protein
MINNCTGSIGTRVFVGMITILFLAPSISGLVDGCSKGYTPTPPPGTVVDISLQGISAPPYTRLAFTEKNNQLKLMLRNDGGAAARVRVSLYAIGTDGETETYLKTTTPTMIPKNREVSVSVFCPGDGGWMPTETGRNWIRGEISVYGSHREWTVFTEFKESFNVVSGFRPVMHIGGDWIIDTPTEIADTTVVVDGDVYINDLLSLNGAGDVIAGDIILNPPIPFNLPQDWAWDMACSYDGQYNVQVNPGGVFNVYGKIWNNPDTYSYSFNMNGGLSVDGQYGGYRGTIENVYGNILDLSQPGGIICTTDDVVIQNGATIRDGRSHGVWLQDSDAIITDSYITGNGGSGIMCTGNSKPTITRSTISGNNANGILLMASTIETAIIKNSISLNGIYGIYLAHSDVNFLTHNVVENNVAGGMFLESANGNVLSQNSIKNNGIGIHLDGSGVGTANVIKENKISNNNWGLDLDVGSANNMIYHNDIIANTIQTIDSGANVWDDGYPSGGNYWSDYTGMDDGSGTGYHAIASDRIGDTLIPHLALDEYPLMRGPIMTFNIPVVLGWNLISTPLVPDDTAILEVLDDNCGDGLTIWDRAFYYDPVPVNYGYGRWLPYRIGWVPEFNEFTDVNQEMGFWVHVLQLGDGFLTVSGRTPTPDAFQSIMLFQGNNYIGYPVLDDSTYTVGDFIADTGALYVGKGNPDGTETIITDPSVVMKKGMGYWVKIDFPIDNDGDGLSNIWNESIDRRHGQRRYR